MVVGACPEQFDLPTPALFGRRPKKLDSPWDLERLQGLRQRQKGREAAGGDQVVSARVANLGQGVVFRVKVDQTATRTAACFECSVDTVRMAGNDDPLSFEEITNSIMGFVLLESDLRILPYLLLDQNLCSFSFGRLYLMIDFPQLLIQLVN